MLVLCGIDGSVSAALAANVAVDLVQRIDGSLLFVHVAEPTPIPAGTPPEMREEVEAAERQRAQEAAEELLQRWQLANCERLVTYGDPAERLIEVAEERGADVIVIGSHGRSPLRSMVLGSVSSGVVRGAGCPVLVVPRRMAEQT